jgi:hypothetical protein
MNPDIKIEDASVEQLVARFIAIAMAQHDASREYQTTRYNRLFDQMTKIENELKSRENDQRRALLPLLEADDIHLRLKAAIALLAVAPEQARKVLMSIRDYSLLPYSMDATLMLMSLDNGSYVPD